MEIKLYSKENLDLDQIIKENPFEKGLGIKKDAMQFIIHSIISQGIYYDEERLKSLGKREGFIPLSSAILKSKIPEYKNNIRYLIENKIIECDNSYISGIVSKGYKLTSHYRGKRNVLVSIKDFAISQKIKADNPFNSGYKSKKRYIHLERWFDSNLTIDETEANKWIDEYEKEQTMIIESKKISNISKEAFVESLKEKCEGYRINVRHIADKKYHYKSDNTGYRFHSNITNLPKNLRQYLKYNGQELFSIDMYNSQPYSSQIFFQPSFWKTTYDKEKPTLYKLDKDIYRGIREGVCSPCLTIMWGVSSKSLVQTDLPKVTFFKKVVDGTLYEYLAEIFVKEGILSNKLSKQEQREIVKGIVLTLLFDNNNTWYNKKPGSPLQIFKKNFPSIYKMFDLIKGIHHSHLAIILQRIESFLILERVCGRIAQEEPEMPLYTVHDCIVSTKGNEAYIQRVIEEESIKIFGNKPKLKIEYWTIKKGQEV